MGPSLSNPWTSFRPPKPEFTEDNIPGLQGKVYIVSGANTGIGKEVAQMLYANNAKVYVAARSEEKANKAIAEIKSTTAAPKGSLVFLHLDLSDLNQVKEAVQAFLAKKSRLHVLFNNAGLTPAPVEPPPKSAQGYEIALGVNCIGTFLFTRLQTPILVSTAKSEPADTVRVVWLSSFALELFAHKDVGVSLDNLDYQIRKPAIERYGISKSGVLGAGSRVCPTI